ASRSPRIRAIVVRRSRFIARDPSTRSPLEAEKPPGLPARRLTFKPESRLVAARLAVLLLSLELSAAAVSVVEVVIRIRRVGFVAADHAVDRNVRAQSAPLGQVRREGRQDVLATLTANGGR